jgi:hypothetical protein
VLLENALNVTTDYQFITNSELQDLFIKSLTYKVDPILKAAFEVDSLNYKAKTNDEVIPIYSLALVRNPRMRVSKKNIAEAVKKEVIEANEKQEDETMPFSIVNRDNEFCVINTDTEKVMGCHETEGEADDQLTALNINVEEGENAIHTDKPKKRKPKETKEAENPQKEEKAGFIENLKSLSKTITSFLKSAENEEKEGSLFVNDVGIAQKTVNGELWHFTWSTNAFKDREGEIFSTKSLEDYVNNNEDNDDKGFFNLYHINKEDGNFNTDFAKKEWQGIPGQFGRFLVEAGPYLENERGQKAKEFFSKFADGHPDIAPEGWGCSPEYKYLPEERATGTYDTIWITRTSTLPRMAAANIWTETRQLNRGDKMALSEKQMQSAIEVFGQEFVDNMINEGDKRTEDLEAAGVDHKSKTEEPKEVEITQEQFTNLAQEVAKQFQLDNTAMLEALSTMASGLKEMGDRLEELESKNIAKGLAETPSFTESE